MCTVSFLPKSQGFYLAMNRDEKRGRFTGLAPTVVELEGHRAVFPREPSGGTWISANEAGVCLALINWHRIKREPNNGVRSRGEVIRTLAGISTSDEISTAVKNLPLRKLRPFRLIAIVSAENQVIEWRWNLNRLSIRKYSWESRHWFSSGLDEATAEAERTRVCAALSVESAKRDLKWLRRLHRSHEPERGPFSICMHRPTAATVSYTEIAVSGRSVVMRYKDGQPCSRRSTTTKTCKLSRIRATNR
jgi:Transport and Golgi organisation 2